MRLRFVLAAVVPALLSLAVMAFAADRLARRALEAELGARLVAVAQAAAALLPADRVVTLAPGDETTRTYGNVRARLDALARATDTRLFVARADRTALADSDGRAAIGAPLPALERDLYELGQVKQGRAVPSAVLFRGSDGRLYKTGYAPLWLDGKVAAVVGADGSAAAFATLEGFRRLLVTLVLFGALFGAAAAAVAALGVTRPIAALAAGARRIGEGDLASPLPATGGGAELATLSATLEEMRRSLAARDEERETMLAGIAHEVRNPLGGMELFAGLLAEELAGTPPAAHVERIRAELAALTRIVEEFLDYARTRPPAVERFDAAGFAAEVAELARPLAEARGVALFARGEGALDADRAQLRRAALNLARNAVEASSAGATVELEATPRALRVLDRGAGVPTAAREKLFRPFFTTKEKGTGLGLALAQKIARAHGGALTLAAREGGGTEAKLTF